MAKGSWVATDVDSTVLDADAGRSNVVLQHHAGDEVWLGFGEAAAVGEGIRLSEMAPYLQVTDARAQMAIHVLCRPDEGALGGYQTT
jgi:hypothetical protein